MPPWGARRRNAPFSLEIKPDRDYILLNGSASETRDATIKVTGHVVLKSSEECLAKHGVHVRLWGRMQVNYTGRRPHDSNQPPLSVSNSHTFLEQEQQLSDPITHTPIKVIHAGELALPYTFVLPGDTSETIAGMGRTGVVYGIESSLEKATTRMLDLEISNKKIRASRPLRIVRTLSDDEREELIDRAEQVGSWEPKCSYTFGSTSRAVPFGSQIGIDFQLTPVNPKLTVGKIRLTLKERRKYKTWAPSADAYPRQEDSQNGWWVTESEVVKQIFRMPEGARRLDPATQADKYQHRFWLDLPTSLNRCRQTVEDHPHIRLKHTLHYEIELCNPEGHISQVNAHHSIRLFISEHRPLDGNDCAQPETGAHTQYTRQNTLEDLQQPPPLYDRYYLDEMFDDTLFIGERTPGTQSGAASPLQSSSRSNSYGNLTSLAANPQEPMPEDLARRLAQHVHGAEHPISHLRDVESTDGTPESSRNNSIAVPPVGGITQPGRPSPPTGSSPGIVGAHPPPRVGSGWNMEALSRISSYDTALRTPARSPEDEPPSYEDATSRPPSPR